MSNAIKIALVGNPNCGKTSLFNALTGLNQSVGNYSGATVERKNGYFSVSEKRFQITDLPGVYSVFSSGEDEQVACKSILNDNYDVIFFVADASNLKRSLLLYNQLLKTGVPIIFILNMLDIATSKGIELQIDKLSENLGKKVFEINARKKVLDQLEQALISTTKIENQEVNPFVRTKIYDQFKEVNLFLDGVVERESKSTSRLTERIDGVLLNRFLGIPIFLIVLLMVFQSVFSWSEAPMEFIDDTFVSLSSWVDVVMKEGPLKDLIVDGILAGVNGVVIFIPQIALLFFLLAIMEETGYMSRVSFLMDKIFRKFGLNGKSVIPLISGTACAVPAIMSARTIKSKKERLLTILVTPFMSCSARLPVYALIIALVIPNEVFFGISYKTLTLMFLYLLGLFGALVTSWGLSKIYKEEQKETFILELPVYQAPRFKNIGLIVFEKVKSFLIDAGKIILAVSIVLWFLSSYAPGDKFSEIDEKYQNTSLADAESIIASEKLEASYIGIIGKKIEPVIKPLGFDWKIGIGLITSFAAREVFVSTISTIYSVAEEDEISLKQKMQNETFSNGKKVYTFQTGISLLLFYVFAMQCMSTLAIVYKETNSVLIPVAQLFFMTGLAYLSSLLAYNVLS